MIGTREDRVRALARRLTGGGRLFYIQTVREDGSKNGRDLARSLTAGEIAAQTGAKGRGGGPLAFAFVRFGDVPGGPCQKVVQEQ